MIIRVSFCLISGLSV